MMDAKTLLGSFDTIAAAPSGVGRLRELIVDLGLRGELVPRIDTEGSARDLLDRIRVERSSKGVRGETETVDVSPHEVPSHWAWTTFGWITDSRLGKMLDQAKNRGAMRQYLRNTNVQWFRFELEDVAEMRIEEREIAEYQLRPGDLLICEGGEPGRVAICDESVEGFVFQKALHRSRPLGGTCSAFLAYILWRDARSGRLSTAFTGTTIRHLTGKSLASYAIPLPPVGEQERIVARIDKLMQLCDNLDARQQARQLVTTRLRASSLDALTKTETAEDLHAAWYRIHTNWEALTDHRDSIDALRQVILQLAVQGRLVCQLSAEEDPAVALARCAHERNRLIAEGYVRQQSPVTDCGEEPFRIPDSWSWTQIDNCFLVSGGIQKTGKRRPAGNSFPYLRVANVQRGRLDLAEIEEFELFNGELERYQLEPGDLLVVEGNGSESEIGRCARWGGELDECVHQNHLIRCRPLDRDLEAFALLYLNSPTGTAAMRRLAVTTSGLYNLSVGKIRAISVPLPPREEQQRIVSRVAELMSLCDTLQSALANESRASEALTASAAHILVRRDPPPARCPAAHEDDRDQAG